MPATRVRSALSATPRGSGIPSQKRAKRPLRAKTDALAAVLARPALLSRPALLRRAALLAGAAVLALGCSFTRSQANCESTSECAAAFGPGTVCSERSLCERVELEPTCQNQFPSDLLLSPEKYKNWVLIGSLLRRTGKEGARHDAARLVIEDVNRFLAQSRDDYPELAQLNFGLIQCDHDGGTQEVARLARYLTEELEVPLILGPASSSRTDAAFRAVDLSEDGSKESRKVLFVSPSATSVALTQLERAKPGMLWRTAPMDDGQGRLMGAYAQSKNTSLAVIYEDTTYGNGLFAELLNSAPEQCDQCGFAFDADSPEATDLIHLLSENTPRRKIEEATTVIFIGAQEKHIQHMVGEVNGAFAGKLLFFSDAAASAETFNTLPARDADRIMGTRVSPPADTETSRFFVSQYEDAYEESPLIHSFTANAYDATWLLVVGSIWSTLKNGRVTPVGAAEGLRNLSDKSHENLDRGTCPVDLVSGSCPELNLDSFDLPAIIESFRAGRGVDVVGASGSLNYCAGDEELERNVSDFELWSVRPSDDERTKYELVTVANGPSVREVLPPCPAD